MHVCEAFPGRRSWHLCPETIYQASIPSSQRWLTRELTRKLRTGRLMRKRRRWVDAHRVRFPTGMSISTRSKEVDLRLHSAPWEGDLIVGRSNRSAIGTLIERHSRYTRLVHLSNGHDADALYAALTDVLLTLPVDLRITLTWDSHTVRDGRWL